MTPRAYGMPDVHIIPFWDDENHEPTAACRCCPIVRDEDPATGRRLYDHVSPEEAN